jgi:hypothetical protein
MRILRSRVSLKADIRPGNAGGKRKETENEEENIYRRMRGLNCGKAELLPVELLPEERFAQLITADEGLGAAIAIEKILDFAILVDLLRRKNRFAGEDLNGVGVRDAIALKAFGLFAVKHGEDRRAGTQQFSELRYQQLA